jgi:hypothetical protein
LQVVALGELRDSRIRHELAHPLDVQIDLQDERHALAQAAAHRGADRQSHARVEVIDAAGELEISRAHFETTLQTLRATGRDGRCQECDGQ